MELWIRSQDRHKLELLNDRLLVQETTVNPHSHWYGIMVDGSYLAEYNSEERALEVLDEIQNILKPITIFKNAEISESTWKEIQKVGVCTINDRADVIKLDTFVYEMPEE